MAESNQRTYTTVGRRAFLLFRVVATGVPLRLELIAPTAGIHIFLQGIFVRQRGVDLLVQMALRAALVEEAAGGAALAGVPRVVGVLEHITVELLAFGRLRL